MGSEEFPLQRFRMIAYVIGRSGFAPLVVGGAGPPPRQPYPTQDGRVGRRVPTQNVQNGDGLTVVARSGSSWEAVVVGVVWQGRRPRFVKPPGAHAVWVLRGSGAERAYPFSTYPAEMQRCDDCGGGMKTPATSRRKRFYAYQRRSGGQCYFDKNMHAHLQRYPPPSAITSSRASWALPRCSPARRLHGRGFLCRASGCYDHRLSPASEAERAAFG